jgi:hypothetical protein
VEVSAACVGVYLNEELALMVKCFSNFNTWRISHQLQASFLSAGLLISTILAMITYLQLDWLRSQMLSETETLLKDDSNVKMYMFAE